MGSNVIPRPNKFEVMFSDEEREIVKRRAKREGLTYSEWIRMACMVTAAFDGDKAAWKLTFRNASTKAKEMVGRLFSEWGGKKVRE